MSVKWASSRNLTKNNTPPYLHGREIFEETYDQFDQCLTWARAWDWSRGSRRPRTACSLLTLSSVFWASACKTPNIHHPPSVFEKQIMKWTHLVVYDPDPTLRRLHPLEVLVQGEVVADGVLNMEHLIMTILRTLLSWSTATKTTFQVAELLLKYADLSRNQL